MIKEIYTLLLAASPISELRGAIPAAILVWGFNPFKAYVLSVIGNALPVIPLLFIWHYLSDYLSKRFYFLNRFFNWLFDRARTRHNHHFEVWEQLALLIFVAIPFPLTGAWSGTVAAFVFGIPFWRAVAMIFGGILISGLIVLLLTTGFNFLTG